MAFLAADGIDNPCGWFTASVLSQIDSSTHADILYVVMYAYDSAMVSNDTLRTHRLPFILPAKGRNIRGLQYRLTRSKAEWKISFLRHKYLAAQG